MRFNPLLDKFPEEYDGIKLNTDFRVGILLSILFNSGKLTDEEKKLEALRLLYGENFMQLGVDVIKLWDGVTWFMSVGYNKCTNKIESTTSDISVGELEDKMELEHFDDEDDEPVSDKTMTNSTLEHDLFNLIDSMYDDKED